MCAICVGCRWCSVYEKTWDTYVATQGNTSTAWRPDLSRVKPVHLHFFNTLMHCHSAQPQGKQNPHINEKETDRLSCKDWSHTRINQAHSATLTLHGMIWKTQIRDIQRANSYLSFLSCLFFPKEKYQMLLLQQAHASLLRHISYILPPECGALGLLLCSAPHCLVFLWRQVKLRGSLCSVCPRSTVNVFLTPPSSPAPYPSALRSFSLLSVFVLLSWSGDAPD